MKVFGNCDKQYHQTIMLQQAGKCRGLHAQCLVMIFMSDSMPFTTGYQVSI